jgi:hypothetical protein
MRRPLTAFAVLLAALGLAACATPERQAITAACAAGTFDACVLAEQQRIAELEAVYGGNVFVW